MSLKLQYSGLARPVAHLAFVLALTACVPTISAQTELNGVIDIHAHTLPSSRPRSIDAIDLAKLAKQAGMRAFVIKDHYEDTAAQAYLVRKIVPGIEIYGGIVLNQSVGGINVAAVERMSLMNGGFGRIVWLPTFDAENQVRFNKEERPFVRVSKDGKLVPEMLDVIKFVKDHQLALATGHVSAQEALMVVHEAKRQGVQRILATHPSEPQIAMSISQMQEAARDGALIEFVYSALLGKSPIPISEYVEAIRKVGPSSCIMSTDFGQPENPPHTVGMADFLKAMSKAGFSQSDLDLMTKTNPAKFLGLQ